MQGCDPFFSEAQSARACSALSSASCRRTTGWDLDFWITTKCGWSDLSCAPKRPLILLQAASAWALELNAPNCTRCPAAGLALLATTGLAAGLADGLAAGLAAGVEGAAGVLAGGEGPAAAGAGGAADGLGTLAVSWQFSILTRASCAHIPSTCVATNCW